MIIHHLRELPALPQGGSSGTRRRVGWKFRHTKEGVVSSRIFGKKAPLRVDYMDKNVSEYNNEYVSEYASEYISEYTSEYISEYTSECMF